MSLKGDKYETAEEVIARLQGTVVMYDGQPVYISRISMPEREDPDKIARVWFYTLPLNLRGQKQEETRKFLSSRKFDLAPFKMGYMNRDGAAYFLSRAPIRQYQQGLNGKVLNISDLRGQKQGAFGFGAFGFNEIVRDKGFVDMVNGKYPTFKDAGELLEEKETSSVAVSRMFAFVIDHDLEALILMHKGIRCGLALKNDKALKIPPKFHFLREEMEECRIPLA